MPLFLFITGFLFLLCSPMDCLLCFWGFVNVLHSSWSALMKCLWPIAARWWFLVVHWVDLCIKGWLLVSLIMFFVGFLWFSLFYLWGIYTETLVVVTIFSTQFLLQDFLLFFFDLFGQLDNFQRLSDWKQRLIILYRGQCDIIPYRNKILDLPQYFRICFIKIKFKLILLQQFLFAPSKYSDYTLYIILV